MEQFIESWDSFDYRYSLQAEPFPPVMQCAFHAGMYFFLCPS